MSARHIIGTTAFTIGTLATVAIFVSALLLLGQADPKETVIVMIKGVIGSRGAAAETLLRFTPLVIIALGLAPSLRVGLFNIGAPGQISCGGLIATLVALNVSLPSFLLIPLCACGGAFGGAACALLPAILRVRLKVNEILSTLVFNFLSVLLLEYLLSGPMHGYHANLPQSEPLPDASWLPILIPTTRANIGILLVPIGLLVAYLFDAGRLGYRLKILGASPSLARQANIDRNRVMILTMSVAGAAAGLAGWLQTAGIDHRLYATVADPIGYTGLFAALVGKLDPFGIFAASLLFAALLRGGDALQIGADVSPEIISALIGLIMLVMAVHAARNRHLSRP
jgi:simple sugar transport system permease protein